jgi:DNA-binding Lrp family transcriptional regulator
MDLSRKEELLLAYLRSNAREQLTVLSRLTGMPVSTVFDKMRKQYSEIINKYTSLLNFDRLGYFARMSVMLRVLPEHRDALALYLAKHPSVNSVHRIANGYDFALEGIFQHVSDAQKFLDILSQRFAIAEKQAYFITEDIKREGFMADPAMAKNFP